MREFLSQNGLGFEYKNIDEDAEAMEELQQLGFRSVPVTVIGDTYIFGFDRARLEAALDELR